MSHKVSASYVRKANRMQSVEPWDRVGAVDKPRQEASCFIHGVWDLSVVNRCPQCPQPVATVLKENQLYAKQCVCGYTWEGPIADENCPSCNPTHCNDPRHATPCTGPMCSACLDECDPQYFT
jgi:rubrerythrin